MAISMATFKHFLEPKCHKGKVYDIHLFTINSDTGDRLYVGCLREAEVLTDEQRSWAAEECSKRGMQNLMSEDLRAVGIINWEWKGSSQCSFQDGSGGAGISYASCY